MNSDFTNGVSRRNFMRILGAASAAATSLPAFASMQAPQAQAPAGRGAGMGAMRNADTVIISSNENPLGPAQSALAAISTTAVLGGRYHQEESQKTITVFNEIFGLKNPAPGAGGRGG